MSLAIIRLQILKFKQTRYFYVDLAEALARRPPDKAIV